MMEVSCGCNKRQVMAYSPRLDRLKNSRGFAFQNTCILTCGIPVFHESKYRYFDIQNMGILIHENTKARRLRMSGANPDISDSPY